MKKILLAAMLWLSADLAFSQDNNSVTVVPLYGAKAFSFYSHSKALRGNPYGFEVSYDVSMSNNDADWVHMLNVRNVSIVGAYENNSRVSIATIDSSRGVIGNTYAVTGRIESSMLKRGNTELLVLVGAGFAYFPKTFWQDKKRDLINAGHFNVKVEVGLSLEEQLSQNTVLVLRGMFLHCSSASLTLPNGSYNLLNGGLGIKFYVDAIGPVRKGYRYKVFEHRSFLEFGFGGGPRDVVHTGYYKNPQTGKGMYFDTTGQKHSAASLWQFSVYAGYNYKVDEVLGLKVGIDGMYYTKPFTYQNFLPTYQETFSSYGHVSIGVSAGADVFLGRLVIGASVGGYVYQRFLYHERFYVSPGVKYFINQSVAVNFKTYFHGVEPHFPSIGIVVTP